MNSFEKLKEKFNTGLHICVGLDTDVQKIPTFLRDTKNALAEFNKKIIEATKDLAAAYKINFAFYEKEGLKGIEALEKTLSFIPADVLTIADAKRGDIGNTAEMYAKSVFDNYLFDSVTVNPYMGTDSIQPFINYKDKLIFFLALTSNPSSKDFQKQKLLNGSFLYKEVIYKVHEWNTNNNCGIVFGATNESELSDSLNVIKALPVLVPGIGAQGGEIEKVAKLFISSGSSYFLFNVSRGIIYKSGKKDFAEKAKEELEVYNSKIKDVLSN